MITVDEATRLVLENTLTLPPEEVPLTDAAGRVLAQDLRADRDFPPFDRVMMDGIALNLDAWTAAGRPPLPVAGIQLAGAPPVPLPDPLACLEIMTGAVLPPGTDTVVRYEDVDLADGHVTVRAESIRCRQNVHARGFDRGEGTVLVRAGQRLSPAELAVAATVGAARLRVAGLPRVAVVSTGNELVPVTETPAPYQIRRSNAPALAAALRQDGLEATVRHLDDDRAAVEAGVRELLAAHDVLILSGGVSKGKADYVPEALAAAGVEKLFHRVAQRPGKPFWFGRVPGGAVVFALPGNPVSTFLGYYRYVRPWLAQALRWPPTPPTAARLTAPFSFRPSLTCFLPVRVTVAPDGAQLATPAPGQGSGDLANLVEADAFLELPADRTDFSAGEAFPLVRYR